mgnify:CR=1 FL=1
MTGGIRKSTSIFLSTPSARRATTPGQYPSTTYQFLSTPSARRATIALVVLGDSPCNFYPRPPRGGRRPPPPHNRLLSLFLSTPSARRATQCHPYRRHSTPISIHALREEGDPTIAIQALLPYISIHALREEGDAGVQAYESTHTDFYPRPPRGGRQQKQRQNLYFLINYTTFCTNLEEP